MRHDGTGLSFSPTDLAAFSACGHRTWLDRLRALKLAHPVVYPDPRLELLRKRGMEHEERLLEGFEAEGKQVVRFEALSPEERTSAGYARRAAETVEALRSGADVVYQATLYDGRWLGFADFLLRVEGRSRLGAWSYEVADAKLAREAKATALLQTCVYSEMLEREQGVAPRRVHLFLGGPRPRTASFRLAHYAAYYRALKARFLDHVGQAPEDPPVAPDPVELCRTCDWKGRCRAERLEADHLSLVAGIGRDHRRALEAAGVTTLEGLARLPLDPPPDGLRRQGFYRIREQARVQLEGRRRDAPYHELIPLEEAAGDDRPLGLSALPEPTPWDLFFDIEGADYAYDEGLEYLFGLSDADDGYDADWALDPDAERAVLERFLERVTRHVEAHPEAHVYHFGHYETTALKRLVGRYGVGTRALDHLLQRQVFVDLHRVVKQAVRVSEEGYSIKALERHYGFERAVALEDANPARGRLELALGMGLPDDEAMADAPIVEGYNRDDCVSTRALRDWLEVLRAGALDEGWTIPRPTPPVERDDREDGAEVAEEVRALMEGLLDGVSEDEALRREADGAHQVRWLAAHLLEWHRREDKSAWWEYFRLRELSVEELVEETRPLAGLEYVGFQRPEKQSEIHRYRVPPQEHRLDAGKKGIDPVTEARREVWAVDEAAGTVDLKVGKRAEWEPEALQALLPDEIVGTPGQRGRLRTTARTLLDGEEALAAWSPASLALLRRTRPLFGDGGASLVDVSPRAPLLDRACRAARSLRDGVLPVQGPPGTGKTYSGARMIRALLRDGKRVGVTGPSHKVISNLLRAVCEADDDEPTDIRGIQATKEEGCGDDRIVLVGSSGAVAKTEAKRVEEGEEPFNLVAGTAWLWCMDDKERSVDVLFIDEAGQFSLANALAVAPAAPKLILLGDPQQLDQPQKGIHPPGTEVSVLEHLAGEDGILAAEQGLFLGETWRMRPEITAYTSELFYEGKLRARPDLADQRIELADGGAFEALHLVEVKHHGNSRESAEEAEAVVAVFRRLLGGRTSSERDAGDGSGEVAPGTFTDRYGDTRPLELSDLLVVAPYNAQVSRISRALEKAGFPGARVGTVDKFQGQEAPVAIYSLASSSADDAPRGMEFLYALDRLNVATSRARVATVVVASPQVFVAECRRPEQMRMVNAVVRYGELVGQGTTHRQQDGASRAGGGSGSIQTSRS